MWYKLLDFLVCYCCIGQSIFKIKTDTPNDPHRNFIASLYYVCTYMIISLGRKSSNQTKNAKKIRKICVIGQILIIIYVTLRTSRYGLDKTIS